MNSLAVWFLIAVPKHECADKLKVMREQRLVAVAEATKSTENASGIAAARAALTGVPPDPQQQTMYLTVEPQAKDFDPCFDVYAEKRYLRRLR